MIHLDEAPIVDLCVVFTDDGAVETLRTGRAPATPGPLLSLLARWRDSCRTGTHQVA